MSDDFVSNDFVYTTVSRLCARLFQGSEAHRFGCADEELSYKSDEDRPGEPAEIIEFHRPGLLSIIPVLGAFVIWIPAAVFLGMQGEWGKAIILAVWGTVIIGLRQHTVPVFVAIVGGLIVFGPSGLILGPVILALTDAIINVWRCRTARGSSAVTPCLGGVCV